MNKRVKVVVYGLFPTLLSTCAATEDLVRLVCRPVDADEQLKEYPSWIIRQQGTLVDIIYALSRYSRFIDVDVVGADSIRGLWLSLKHKLGSKPAVIIDKRVFRDGELDKEKICGFVESIISQHLPSS